MLYPSIDILIEQVDSKYMLVVAASKRARMLRDGVKSDLQSPKAYKYVGVALEELYGEHIKIDRLVK